MAREAQTLGRYYVHVESSKSEHQKTLGQRGDAQLYLIKIPPQSLVNWEEDNGILTEVIIGYPNDTYVYYTADFTQRFYVDKSNTITTIDEAMPNTVGLLPIIKFSLDGNDSQICDIAELNKIVFNLDSLLMEELFKNTFTQFFITGVTPDDLGSVVLQGRKFITIKKPSVTVDPVSGDASQADSIRTTIDGYTKEIYRCAGLHQPDVIQNTESGRALKLRMNEVQQIAAKIADNMEASENRLLEYWSKAMGVSIEMSDYPEDFQTEDLITELGMTLDILDSQLPNVVKKMASKQLATNLFPKMNRVEADELLMELEEEQPGPREPNTPQE